jgi:hypothetical protein
VIKKELKSILKFEGFIIQVQRVDCIPGILLSIAYSVKELHFGDDTFTVVNSCKTYVRLMRCISCSSMHVMNKICLRFVHITALSYDEMK